MQTKLSMIVVNWNTRDLLDACLKSIYTHRCSAEFEVWVVDNASTDDSVSWVRMNYPTVRLIENRENVGFARANNQAMARANGDYLFLLNSDAELRPNSADLLIQYLDAHPEVGAVAPDLRNPDGSYQGAYADFPTLWSEFALMTTLARWTIGPHAPSPPPAAEMGPRRVDWISGAAFMIRRSVYEQIGGLDDGYFMYSEETDWCWRLRQAGWGIDYVPTAQVIHIGGGSAPGRSAETYSIMYMSKLRYFRKIHGQRTARRAKAMFLAVTRLRLTAWRVLQRWNRDVAARQRQDQLLLQKLVGYDV